MKVQHNHMQQVICIFPKKHEWNQGQASRDIIKNNDYQHVEG